ncbi:hypothetical protein [Providencia sp. PROV132]|uniref:hypothetical protein n=1 Tax=Providencia sp. PROV132 TaxID=2949842 RepID=UPI002349AFCE|nr:hypothetical protein [Providencia sp. PROV132]
MEFKGSKSPWHIGSHPFEYRNRHTIRCDNNTVIAHVSQPSDAKQAGIADADTRLIAAAPELLEALIELTESSKEAIDGLGDLSDAIDTAKAAIAKALSQQ